MLQNVIGSFKVDFDSTFLFCFEAHFRPQNFPNGSSFTSWMKEKMDDYYFDAYYIIWEKNYKAWDTHLCHW